MALHDVVELTFIVIFLTYDDYLRGEACLGQEVGDRASYSRISSESPCGPGVWCSLLTVTQQTTWPRIMYR